MALPEKSDRVFSLVAVEGGLPPGYICFSTHSAADRRAHGTDDSINSLR